MMDIDEALANITDNLDNNKKVFLQYFNKLTYTNNFKNSLYHLIMIANAPLRNKEMAFATLINNHVNPNITNDYGDTFIHTAIKHNNNVNFILDMLHYVCKNGFNVNQKNKNGLTILHTAINYFNNSEDTIRLIEYIGRENFNFYIEDSNGYTLLKYIDIQSRLSRNEKKRLNEAIERERENIDFKNYLPENNKDYEIKYGTESIFDEPRKSYEKSRYGTILNERNFLSEPAIGREKEIKKLIVSLATDKKIPLLVGPSGVGKTTIIDELAYIINKKNLPNFLKNKIILEVSAADFVADTRFRGELERKVKEVVNYCIQNDAILFIDEFHSLKGAGASTDDKNDVLNILRDYVDRHNLKLIGATTDVDYEEILSKSNLKRRFEIIKIDKLDKSILYEIIIKTMQDKIRQHRVESTDTLYNNLDKICEILIDVTDNKHIIYNDTVNNPDLIVSIINKSFAYLLVNDDYEYDIKHIILALDDNERIYPIAKDEAILKLENLYTKESTKKKVLVYNISDYR